MLRIPALICLALALTGCRERAPSANISDEHFIDIVVALRQQAAATTGDSASYVAARNRVLAEQNVTYDDLKQYVEVRSRDLARYAGVWETINRRLAPEELH